MHAGSIFFNHKDKKDKKKTKKKKVRKKKKKSDVQFDLKEGMGR